MPILLPPSSKLSPFHPNWKMIVESWPRMSKSLGSIPTTTNTALQDNTVHEVPVSASSVRASLPDRPCCHPGVLGATELQKSHEITVSAGLQPPFLKAPPKEASGQAYLTAPQLPSRSTGRKGWINTSCLCSLSPGILLSWMLVPLSLYKDRDSVGIHQVPSTL